MIVRDESAVLERCLESVRGLVDSWTICDTGSVDETPAIVERLLGDLPGALHHRPWRNFGHNRSELMKLARGSADYLLLIDADMIVERHAPLPRLTADAYLIRHRGDLDYAVVRLVDGARDWWFEGATHEYLATDGEFEQAQLDELSITHLADGGSRAEKFDRDRRLLEGALEKNPNDDRSTFYLAQTERDAGNADRAIELYRRRVELGGWDEEVFYAAFQAGLLTAAVDARAGVAELESARRLRPSRAEPLVELARLHRELGEPQAGLACAAAGLELDYPGDILFVHRDVYEWGLRLELARCALAAGAFEQAALACQRLLAEGRLPQELVEEVEADLDLARGGLPAGHQLVELRATPLLGRLLRDLELGEVRLEIDPPWPQFNPSVAARDGGFRMIVRSANYRIDGGRYVHLEPGETVRTLNYIVDLGAEHGLESVRALIDETDDPTYPTHVRGFEDCRLIEIGGRWLATATTRDRNPDAVCEVVLLEIAEDTIERATVLAGPQLGRDEKNWMPFRRDNRLALVYSCGPSTRVLECDPRDGSLAVVAEQPAPGWTSGFRGGSQGIEVGEGWLFVVHEVEFEGSARHYLHRFVLIGRELRLAAASPQFTFTGAPTEVCVGLAAAGDELVLSFGVGDAVAMLARCSRDDTLALLKPIEP